MCKHTKLHFYPDKSTFSLKNNCLWIKAPCHLHLSFFFFVPSQLVRSLLEPPPFDQKYSRCSHPLKCFLHALRTAWQIVSSSMPSSKRLPTRSMICFGSCIPIILKGKSKACLKDSEILASLAGYASIVTRSLDTAIL